jgi:hypothetical protein
MKRFLVLYESPVPAADPMKAPPEQMKAGFEFWTLETIPVPAAASSR